MSMDLQQRQEQTPAVQSPEQLEVMRLLQLGIERNISPDALREIVALQREIRKDAAELEFARDMADFQATCPPIQRIKHNEYVTKSGQKVEYESAPLEEICAVIRGHAKQYGISFNFTASASGAMMTIKCLIRHKNNATPIESEMPIVTTSGNPGMSDQQKWASAQTFAKRYALINAFGLNLVDAEDPEDDPTAITEEHATTLAQMMTEACKSEADRVSLFKYLSAASGREIAKLSDLREVQYPFAVRTLEQKRKGASRP